MADFRNLIKNFHRLVKQTETEESPPDYHKLLPDVVDSINTQATHIINELNQSELAKAENIPLIVYFEDATPKSSLVKNDNRLGIYLFALALSVQVVEDENHAPQEVRNFIGGALQKQEALLDQEINKLYIYAPDDLWKATKARLIIMNEEISKIFDKHLHPLQIAALASSEESQERYAYLLKELNSPIVPNHINTSLEVAILLESLAAHTAQKTLAVLANNYIALGKEQTPSEELLNQTETALENIGTNSDKFGADKVRLINEYVRHMRTQEVAPATWAEDTSVKPSSFRLI